MINGFIIFLIKVFDKFLNIIYIHTNRLYLHLLGIKYGKNLIVCNKIIIRIHKESIIKLGNNVTIFSKGKQNAISQGASTFIKVENRGVLDIQDSVGISSSCIWCKDRITIGTNVKIGANCLIMDHDAHSLNYKLRASNQKDIKTGLTIDDASANRKAIFIKDDVLIGANCIILKGVEIGERTIIGAGSVVTKSIPSDCIAAGNPCKIIKIIKNE